MFDGHRRWTWLGVLAAANFLLWVGVACLVALCAGDDVDLGVETLARHAQATAVISWEEVTTGRLPRTVQQVAPSTPRARDQDGEISAPQALATVDVSPDENPATTVPRVATSWPSNLDVLSEVDATFTVPAMLTPAAASGLQAGSLKAASSPEPGAEPVEPKPQGEADPPVLAGLAIATPGIAARAIVSSPLLLADPEFHSLTVLNAEMDRSAPGRAVQIRYQEEALNQEIAALWLNNPALPYRDVQVDLQHNGVAISGQVTVFGLQVDALLEGTVVARDCQPRLEVESISLAGVMTPRFVRAQVVAMAHESMAWYPADYPLCLEQIVLEETRATIYGYRR